MADSLQFLLSCQICLEDFQEDGDLIPRILPCSHTLCERCLIHLLEGGGSFKCPECRAQHAAPSKEKSFPQNKYLLTVIKRRESREEEPEEEVRKSRNIKSVLVTCTATADLQTKIFNGLPRYNFLHFQCSFPENWPNRLPLTPFGLVKEIISLTSLHPPNKHYPFFHIW